MGYQPTPDTLNNVFIGLARSQHNAERYDRFLKGPEVERFLREAGYLHCALVFFEPFKRRRERQSVRSDLLPWFDQEGQPIEDRDREEVDSLFRSEHLTEVGLFLRHLSRRSADEQDSNLMMIPGGELAAIIMRFALATGDESNRPDPSAICRETGLLSGSGLTTKAVCMLEWMQAVADERRPTLAEQDHQKYLAEIAEE